jgi:hypothetical protein
MTDVLHHLSDRAVGSMLKQMHESITGDGPLIILDVDRKPLWKFCTAAFIDRCLNPGAPLFYRSRHSTARVLARHAWTLDRLIPAHRDLPLSDIIYVCRKRDRTLGAPDAKGETASF